MSRLSSIMTAMERPELHPLQFREGTRFMVLGLATVCLTLCIANSLAFNFTVICMTNEVKVNGTLESVSIYSNSERDLLFLAVAFGAILGTLPVTKLNELMGLRKSLTLYGLIASAGTLLLPAAVQLGVWAVFICRVCQGIAQGITFPATGGITQQWATVSHSSTFLAILSCYHQFASVFTMPLGGAFCVSSLGWPALYYLLGGVSVFFYTAFFLFYRNEPHRHRHVSHAELSRIMKDKGENTSSRQRVPYRQVLTDKAIVAIWISTIGGNGVFQIFLQYGPTYLHEVLHFEVATTGFATALPFVLSAAVKVLAGPLSDYTKCISEKTKVMMFAAISQGVMALCIVALALIPLSVSFLGQLFYTLAIAFSGLNVVGVIKCAQLVARQHIHFVMAVISMLASITLLLVPLLVSAVVPNGTPTQWSMFLLGSAAFLVLVNGYFLIRGDAKPAAWCSSHSSTVFSVPEKEPPFADESLEGHIRLN